MIMMNAENSNISDAVLVICDKVSGARNHPAAGFCRSGRIPPAVSGSAGETESKRRRVRVMQPYPQSCCRWQPRHISGTPECPELPDND